MRSTKTHIPLMVFVVLVLTIVAPTTVQKAQTKPQYYVEITSPDKNGLQRGRGMNVEGKASIPGGEHLWVFSRRSDFKGVWWPQGEGEIDPDAQTWRVAVTFGESQDIGWDFDIAVITVTEKEHIKLERYRTEAMRTGRWLPIEMPETTRPPQFRKIKKVSHD